MLIENIIAASAELFTLQTVLLMMVGVVAGLCDGDAGREQNRQSDKGNDRNALH